MLVCHPKKNFLMEREGIFYFLKVNIHIKYTRIYISFFACGIKVRVHLWNSFFPLQDTQMGNSQGFQSFHSGYCNSNRLVRFQLNSRDFCRTITSQVFHIHRPQNNFLHNPHLQTCCHMYKRGHLGMLQAVVAFVVSVIALNIAPSTSNSQNIEQLLSHSWHTVHWEKMACHADYIFGVLPMMDDAFQK